jgi:two-component system CheB/CheR fusion protein
MNEELQSTNEELSTMNDELRMRGEALNDVNSLLESILTSLRGAVVVVDPELKIIVWNQGAEELWGLREDEVRGNNILGLDIGLPTEQLKRPVRACLTGSKSRVTFLLDAVNRRGRAIVCQVTTTPLVTRAGSIRGVIIVMNEQRSADGDDGHTAGRARGAAPTQNKRAR